MTALDTKGGLPRRPDEAVTSQRRSCACRAIPSASSVVEVVAKMKIAWNHRLAIIQIRLLDFHRSAEIPARLSGAVPSTGNAVS
jgi:hypothetical protein